MAKCWRCGRPMPRRTQYLFGEICDRADCRRVKQAFNPAFKTFWACWVEPTEEHMGRASCWSHSGEITGCKGFPAHPDELERREYLDTIQVMEGGSA